MKTYLITGGAGFIGSNFVKYMRKTHPGIQLVVFDALTYAGNLGTLTEDLLDPQCHFQKGNICDPEALQSLFRSFSIDCVVNFAAESHVDRSIDNPRLFLETNILGTQNLLHVAKSFWTMGQDEKGYPTWKEGVKFLQVSTDEVYGSLGSEGYFTESTPLDPRSPYSASKASADLMVKAYAETYKMPVNITRCSNNYGPYHFPEKLIPLVIKNILEGKSLPVYGDGRNVRDWLYVEDHCKAIDLVLHRGRSGEIYNVGGHNEKQNLDIVRLILSTLRDILEKEPAFKSALKKKEPAPDGSLCIDWINENLIVFVRDRLGHDMRYAIDPSKISSELGWKPETSFEKGIVKTVYWYLEHQDWVEKVTSGEYQHYYKKMYGADA